MGIDWLTCDQQKSVDVALCHSCMTVKIGSTHKWMTSSHRVFVVFMCRLPARRWTPAPRSTPVASTPSTRRRTRCCRDWAAAWTRAISMVGVRVRAICTSLQQSIVFLSFCNFTKIIHVAECYVLLCNMYAVYWLFLSILLLRLTSRATYCFVCIVTIFMYMYMYMHIQLGKTAMTWRRGNTAEMPLKQVLVPTRRPPKTRSANECVWPLNVRLWRHRELFMEYYVICKRIVLWLCSKFRLTAGTCTTFCNHW